MSSRPARSASKPRVAQVVTSCGRRHGPGCLAIHTLLPGCVLVFSVHTPPGPMTTWSMSEPRSPTGTACSTCQPCRAQLLQPRADGLRSACPEARRSRAAAAAWSPVVDALTVACGCAAPGQMAGTVFVGRYGELERLAGSCVATLDLPRRLWSPATPASARRGCSPRPRGAVPGRAVLAGSCLPLSESLPYGAITDAFDRPDRPGRPPGAGPGAGPVRTVRAAADRRPDPGPVRRSARPRRISRLIGLACSPPSGTCSRRSARTAGPRSWSRTCTGPTRARWTC